MNTRTISTETLQVSDQAEQGVILTDETATITYVNDMVINASGYSKDQLVGKHLSVFQSDHSSNLSECSCYKFNKNEDNNLLLNNILDNTDAIISIKDAYGKYQMTNRRFTEICQNIQQEEVLGKTDEELFSSTTAKQIMGNDRFVLKAGEGMEFEEIFEQAGGEHIYHSNKIPIKEKDGCVSGLFCISNDISTRKRMEQQLRIENNFFEMQVDHRTKELKQVNNELEAFCSAISHDLRSPLGVILGYAQLMLMSQVSVLGVREKKFIKAIETASVGMENMITSLLQLSRSNQEQVNATMIDLSSLCRKVVLELKESDDRRKVYINIQEELIAEGDENLLCIVITNLIHNAWKYTKKTSCPVIEVGAFIQNTETVYFVKDNGAGFDMSQQHKLFAPFKRLHTEADFAGTGVGLCTVKRIIIKHGGDIWAESKPGEGAIFFFTLKKARSAKASVGLAFKN